MAKKAQNVTISDWIQAVEERYTAYQTERVSPSRLDITPKDEKEDWRVVILGYDPNWLDLLIYFDYQKGTRPKTIRFEGISRDRLFQTLDILADLRKVYAG